MLLGMVRILGLVWIRHDEEATKGPVLLLMGKHKHHNKSRPKIAEIIYIPDLRTRQFWFSTANLCWFLPAEKV
jgi:hypothetical protein